MEAQAPVSKWWWRGLRVLAGTASAVAAWRLAGWGTSGAVLALAGFWLAWGWRWKAAALGAMLGWLALALTGKWEALPWVGLMAGWFRLPDEGSGWTLDGEWRGWMAAALAAGVATGWDGGAAAWIGAGVALAGLADPRRVRSWAGAGEVVRVAFDAECLMCSRSVRFLAEEDGGARLRFLPLQSTRGRKMAGRAGAEELKSVVVEAGDRCVAKSEAVVMLLRILGGHWRVIGELLRPVPSGWADLLYEFVAKRRYRWWGKAEACELPGEALRWRLESGEEQV